MEENTDYQLSSSVRDGIVEIVCTGEITKNSLERIRAEVITILREKNAQAVLWDGRGSKGPHEITAMYFRVRSVPQDVKFVPCAIVEPSDRDFQSFTETTSANAGMTIKFFTDIEAARAWLKRRLKEIKGK